jgi:proline iminopeptidase
LRTLACRTRASEANTTWDLVGRHGAAARALWALERWQLFGGSWGSTLSLAYAQTHPARVQRACACAASSCCAAPSSKWFYQDGCSWLFPEAFEDFAKDHPPEERGDMIAAYYRRLTHPDRDVQIKAARAWSVWEGSTLSLHQDPERVKLFGADTYAIAFAPHRVPLSSSTAASSSTTTSCCAASR